MSFTKIILNIQCSTDGCNIKIHRSPSAIKANKSGKFFCCRAHKDAEKLQQVHSTGLCLFCTTPLNNPHSKYCNKECHIADKRKRIIEAWYSGTYEATTSHGGISKAIRAHLFEINNKCSKCEWNVVNLYTNKIPLQVDHIDGNWKDSSPGNVQLLCPNCHSLTKTFGGANVGNGNKRPQSNPKRTSSSK